MRLGELIRPSSVERCGDRSFPILSITKQDGITFQADKFKKRIASANTNTYKVIPRGKLVQGIHIDEANFGIQDIIDYGVVSPAYKVWDVNSDRVVPEYLAQALRSDYCIDYYRKNLSGTVNRRGRMSNEVFYQLALFLPSLAEQKRRLDVLQHVSALVQCQTRAVEAFDSLVKCRVIERQRHADEEGSVDEDAEDDPPTPISEEQGRGKHEGREGGCHQVRVEQRSHHRRVDEEGADRHVGES